MGISILWFRRDLRLSDHPALLAAVEAGAEVLPVFVRDPGLLSRAGARADRLAASVAAWKAAGLTWEPREKPVNGQGFLTGPDGVRIEIYINTTIATPIAMHHLHLMLPDPVAAQKWYAAVFGATAGQRLASTNSYLIEE